MYIVCPTIIYSILYDFALVRARVKLTMIDKVLRFKIETVNILKR